MMSLYLFVIDIILAIILSITSRPFSDDNGVISSLQFKEKVVVFYVEECIISSMKIIKINDKIPIKTISLVLKCIFCNYKRVIEVMALWKPFPPSTSNDAFCTKSSYKTKVTRRYHQSNILYKWSILTTGTFLFCFRGGG